MVVGFAVAMAAWSTGLHYIGISMGYLYLLMGVIISSAVLPATLTLMWSKQNWAAATFSPPLGFACSLIAWLVTAQKESGELTVASTGANNPMLAGNVVALLSPIIFVPVFTYAFGPQNYDWLSMKAIRKGDDHDLADAAHVDLERIPGEQRRAIEKEEEEQAKLTKASRIARWLTLFMAISFLVLWPMPMYGSSYIFSKKFFTGWVVVGILWMFCSCFAVGVYPLWEGRKTSVRTFKSIYMDVTGKKKPVNRAEVMEGVGSDTPPEAASEKMMKG
jgi:Na+/proline symporter